MPGVRGTALNSSSMVHGYPPLYMSVRTIHAFCRQERLMVPDLAVLWVNRARHLAQQLHSTSIVMSPNNIPSKTEELIR